MKAKPIHYAVLVFVIAVSLTACNKSAIITNGDLRIEIDNNMYSRVNATTEGTQPFNNDFQLSDYLVTKNFTTDKFTLTEVKISGLNDNIGAGTETALIGTANQGKNKLTKIVSIKTYDSIPNLAIFNVSYFNNGSEDIQVKSWVNNNYKIKTANSTPDFWAFQGSSTSERNDWIKPLEPGFYQKNFMGMNQSDYGGGIPVTDIWRKDGGIAIGHTEMVPKEVSLPTDFDKYTNYVQIAINKEFDDGFDWIAGDTLTTFGTFVLVHKGDYFSALSQYSKLMQKKGIKFAEREDAAFESIWCGWGYERNFTADEIINTLPKVKELGIQWAVIDDGFQVAEGDWSVDTKRFPGGEKDMKRMVDAIHAQGLKAKLWWAPLAADPGSKVLQEYPDVLLMNKAGAPQYITWWDSYLMSPASQATLDHTNEMVDLFLNKWDFDGLKMDGQHMNAVPPEYNWDRPSENPEESVEMLPGFFKMIYDNARKIKPNAVVENCPCGTCMSFYNMPYANQTVASDATSGWQLRHRGRTYKAIMPQTAYYGDHIENTETGVDFASAFGVGAVFGTKFTWPKDNPNVKKTYLLTPDKEVVWKKWFSLYHEKMLSKEKYIGNLYDVGYDKPETHVIEKNDTLYYAFYAKQWKGTIELRGLHKNSNYKAYDYVNNKEIGAFCGDYPTIDVQFDDFLLIAVSKAK